MLKKVGAQLVVVTVLLLAASVSVITAGGAIDAIGEGQAVEAASAPVGTVWSTGWIEVPLGSSYSAYHNLGGDVGDYAVELWFADTEAGGLGVHSYGYGGFEHGGNWVGGFWRDLSTSAISLAREQDDEMADLMMARIRVVDPPDYDSDWVEIAAGEVLTLTHNLGGDPEDYAVSMWFEDQHSTLDVHSRRFGGAEAGGSFYGAHWQNLTDATVRVFRAPDELFVGRIRLRIVKSPPPPDYDSGWLDIDPGETLTMTHNLGGNPLQYRGSFQYRDTSTLPNSLGQNARYVGGAAIGNNLLGGHWQQLTNSTVEVVRQLSGARTSEVRVRLWAPRPAVYLPFVVKSP